jgi:hypothetical protein
MSLLWLFLSVPHCRYDPKEKRYVLMWASGIVVDKETNGSDKKIRAPESFDSANPLFMAVSATNNPMGELGPRP